MIPIIAPARRKTCCNLREARAESRREMRECLERAKSSVKLETISATASEHPAMAVAVAVAGGCLLSRLLSARGLRTVARMAIAPLAKAAIVRHFSDTQ